jgi:DNA primase
MSVPTASFIDFKILRKGLSFESVLKHYNVEVKRQPKGNRHVGFCPLPTHQGKRKSPSFSAKLDWGVWQCFGCKASGNVLDFAIRMEGLDPSNHQNLRQVALKLQEIFKVPGADEPSGSASASPTKPKAESNEKPPPTVSTTPGTLPVVINPPLDFQLRNLDPSHPYLRDRGIMPETISYFGLGYCNRGLMAGRFVIPLHNLDNNLVGYAGRLVDDSSVGEYHPKYKFPGSRERNGQQLEFRASYLVYNANRLPDRIENLIVVEGFPSVWWLTQFGYRNVVALMGCSCSDEQARIIIGLLAPEGRVWIMSDADPSGINCAESVFTHLAPHRWVRWVKLPKGQPTDYTLGDFENLLGLA